MNILFVFVLYLCNENNIYEKYVFLYYLNLKYGYRTGLKEEINFACVERGPDCTVGNKIT